MEHIRKPTTDLEKNTEEQEQELRDAQNYYEGYKSRLQAIDDEQDEQDEQEAA